MFVIISICILVWIVQFHWKSRRVLKLSRQLRNKYRALPFVGHGYMFVGSDVDRMNALEKLGREAIRNGGLTSLWIGREYFSIIVDADIAENVLKKCLEKPKLMSIAKSLTGNGSLFASPIEIWRSRRQLITPTFSSKNLRNFFDVFSKQSSILVKRLQSAAGSDVVSIWKYITSYTMETVCETTLGINAQRLQKDVFLNIFDETTQLGSARIFQPWLQVDALYKLLPCGTKFYRNIDILWNIVDEIVKAKREAIRKTLKNEKKLNEDKRNTFLELLMKSVGEDKDDADVEVREEVLVIALAGTDTSAVGASFTAVTLSHYPDVQKKIFQELREVFGDSDRPITPEDLGNLKYLDAVIKESLRLYPPLPIIMRQIDKDIRVSSDITLVENTGALINILSIHRNPRYWGSDAEEFNPDRFLNGPLRYPNAYLPFSSGPRNCVGFQYAMISLKTLMATILRRYRFLPAIPSTDEGQQALLPLKYDVMLRHVDGFMLRVQKRR